VCSHPEEDFPDENQLEKPHYYSMSPEAEMQKSSIGFDYYKCFSRESGDGGTFALQARLALTVNGEEGPNHFKREPQIYNAYFKWRTPGPLEAIRGEVG